MNSKVIKSILRKKVDEWLESIKDESVRRLAASNTIVSGGCIVNLLLDERVKDYDVYFRTHEAAKAIATYYAAEFNTANGKSVGVKDEERTGEPNRISIYVESKGVEEDESETVAAATGEDAFGNELPEDEKKPDAKKPKFRPVFLSSNAVTLSDKVQLIIRFYGEPDVIHENYDFAHCTNYWTSWNSELVLRPTALEAILTKELRYIGSKYPVCSIIRTRKFLKRGWKINAGQYIKMIFQASRLDLTNIEVLRDQLTGVDSAYFAALITALEEKKAADQSFTLNSGYLAELIDRIF